MRPPRAAKTKSAYRQPVRRLHFGAGNIFRGFIAALQQRLLDARLASEGIISPRAFIDEVVNERLPNVFMPDDPRRIATDTSQKVGIRFGETIRGHLAVGRDLDALVAIPLALAGWLRYLLGVGDDAQPMDVSPDPMKDALQEKLKGIEVGGPESYRGQLREILSNEAIFGSNLCRCGLAERIERFFVEEIAGAGAVRATLHRHLFPESE